MVIQLQYLPTLLYVNLLAFSKYPFTERYDVKGDCKGSIVVKPNRPTLLRWDLDEECKKTILSCVQVRPFWKMKYVLRLKEIENTINLKQKILVG